MMPGEHTVSTDAATTPWKLTGRYRWEKGWWGMAHFLLEERRQRFIPPIQPSYVQGWIPGKYVVDVRWRRAKVSDILELGYPMSGNVNV
jgi:predicted N-acyltransferase